jgi:pimeloyl-ACP methyl ester carboxylesterase
MTEQEIEMQKQLEMMANSFLYIKRQPILKTPADYGMDYKELTIRTEDGVDLSAWLIKGTKDKTIIFGHPGAFSKYGYSIDHEGEAKSGYHKNVEFLPSIKHLVEAGYSVIMYDQRNHGASGLSPEGGIHDPFKAHLDNVAVVEFAANYEDLKGNEIGLLSHCQTSYKSMVGMSEQPEVYKKAKVKALVAIQPIDVKVFYKGFGIPEVVIDGLRKVYAEKGVDLDKHNPALFADKITVPTLFVQNVNDPWSDMEHSKEIYDKIGAEKEAIWLDETEKHRFLTYNWFNDHPEKLIAFFDKHLN